MFIAIINSKFDEIAKNYLKIDEELVESIDIMNLQDEGLLFLTSR